MDSNTIIGVISEGHADRAVITNILKGTLGIDDSNIRALLPINKLDETDRSRVKDIEEFGGWTSVRNECVEKKIINQFLAVEGQDFIVVHLDTAEASQYGVTSIPKKDSSYSNNLRTLVVKLVDDWLKEKEVIDCVIHAIAVEETDAWLLTIHDNVSSDTTKSADPKNKLSRILGKESINSTSNYENYLKLSTLFSKAKEVRKFKFPAKNASLKEFIDEIVAKIKNKTDDN